MKRIVLSTLTAIFLTPFFAGAQVFSDERFAEPARTEANHSISIELVGLHYAYEFPIGRKATIIGRAGVNFGMALGSWRTGTGVDWANSDFLWMAAPVIEIEPRWYYGLDRRERHGRSTDKNAGSFLSLGVQNIFPGYISDSNMRIIGSTTFAPAWGLRRVWAEHWMFEFATGLRFGVTHEGDWWGGERTIDHLDVNVRFGYAF